ncbi:hypothetical protein [Bdellovibrio svalbardensis]|uniref:Uncharacterized protein n=1 Tax=Bdellovibrio svalbardensis TaxID=2972972 RepID=A0ABT6DHA8_9BACT|nr:hypothetical protein [Bdellovibrio svalbardensis]MDG0815889.1 hypothetical protein [Bdellovibrio svalbardensis]
MRSTYSTLMQSKYFNPAFNSAIFDGPVRIYFAQFHEALALKIYFMVQQKLTQELVVAKERAKASGANIMVMIYPTAETFELSFDAEGAAGSIKGPFEIEKWNEDVVIGLRGPIEDENLDLLVEALRLTMESWRPAELLRAVAPAEL